MAHADGCAGPARHAAARPAADAAPVVSPEGERQKHWREIQAIKERYADDEDALHAELMRHHAEHGVNVTANIWPPIVAGLASALVNRTVRRRLAPTLVVSRGPAEQPESPHSP